MAVYSHIIPPQATSEELIAATPYNGVVTVADDLMMIILGERIEIVNRREVDTESFENSRVLQ